MKRSSWFYVSAFVVFLVFGYITYKDSQRQISQAYYDGWNTAYQVEIAIVNGTHFKEAVIQYDQYGVIAAHYLERKDL